MPKNEDGEFELILGNKQLLSVFFIVVILLGVFFAMGFIVGRNSPAPTTEAASARRSDAKPVVVDSGQPKAVEPLPAPRETAPQQPAEPLRSDADKVADAKADASFGDAAKIAAAKLDDLKAKEADALAQKAYARAQDLYQHHAIAEQNLEQAQSAEVQAGGDLVAAQAALKVMGITDPDALVKAPPSFEVPVKAPIGGLVVEQDVSAGQLIQPGSTQCFVISDVSTVWVLVNVYQKDLPYVRVGDQVAIQTDTYPEVFHGRISYVAASLDPNTRTLQARIETTNPGEKLKKDMYVVATVNAGTIPNAIALPDAAVLRDSENQPFVYAAASANQFGRRSVTLGESLDGQTRIISGLQPGDRVIGNGSLFLQFANSLQR